MAHEMSFSNGIAEAMYAEQPAWHGLGTTLDYAPDSSVAIEKSHLNWHVGMEPVFTRQGVEIPDTFATVRGDTGAVLGVVGGRYQVVQNREAFDFLDSLLQDGVMKYESAGALRGGRIVWVLGRLPSVDTIAEGDDSLRYVLFSTSHDGSASIHALPTSVRVVCANTLRLATLGDVGFRHTGNVQEKLTFARQYLSQFDTQFTLFRDNARTLATRRYTPEQAKEYIETLFPVPTATKEDSPRSHTIRENKVKAVRDNFKNARNTLPSIKGTWWALLNSVTESIDHTGKELDTDGRERRMISLMDGNGADFKSKALELALTMAG